MIIPVIAVALLLVLIRLLTTPQPIAVELYTVDKGTVAATVVNTRTGTIKACRRSMLAPAIGGEVETLSVSEGDHVTAGQVLMAIWNQDIKARLQLAEARKSAAEARLKEACRIARGAGRESARLQRLWKDKLVSEDIVDRAVTETEARQAACEATQASVAVSEAQIRLEQSNLERTLVRAPFDGVVAEVNAELGEYVTPSPPGIPTPPAIDLLDLSCIYVSAPVDEVDAPPVRTGMPACITLDAFPDKHCNGRVRRIAPYVLDREKQARTVEVEIILDETEIIGSFLPGYSADIEITLQERHGVVRIPTMTILNGDQVLLFDENSGELTERTIETGLSNWNHTEVTSGLKAGDRIVLSVGQEGIGPGVRVKPLADQSNSDDS